MLSKKLKRLLESQKNQQQAFVRQQSSRRMHQDLSANWNKKVTNLLAICQNLDGMITYDVNPVVSDESAANSSRFNRFGTILRKSFTLGHNKKKFKHDDVDNTKSHTLNNKKGKNKCQKEVLQEYSIADFSGSSKNSLCDTRRLQTKAVTSKSRQNDVFVSGDAMMKSNESEHIDCILCDIIGLRTSCKGGLNEGKLQ